MELTSLISILDVNLTRIVKSTRNDKDIISFSCENSFTVEYDETSKENVEQICLKNNNDEVYVYLNYLARRNYLKLKLDDITSFEVIC